MKKTNLLITALFLLGLILPVPALAMAPAGRLPATLPADGGIDADADGIADAEDNCVSLANPDQKDADLDGHGDACDAFPADPFEWMDGDEDGIGDEADNCPATANPDQTDADLDDAGDACDAFPADPDEWADTDGDAVGENTDNCVAIANPDQADADLDARGDACDAFPNDPAEWADADADGVGDNTDNCAAIANPDQANADQDAAGDACDAFPQDPSEWADGDADGIGDEADNCPAAANPDQADADLDGVGDACVEPAGETCNAMAQRIADAVNALAGSGQAERTYTCEDIMDIFNGSLTGGQLGFGQMWQATRLAAAYGEMTWEAILDWKLGGSGWGLLNQLARMRNSLDGISLADLLARMEEGFSARDLLTAGRLAARFGAGLDDVLQLMKDGELSKGELAQFLRLAETLDVDLATLAGYLDQGVSLKDLRQAERVAGQLGADWTEVADWMAQGHKPSEIRQAFKLAGEGGNPADVLAIGLKEYRRQMREQEKDERQQGQGNSNDNGQDQGQGQGQSDDDKKNKEEENRKTAERLARKYDVTPESVLDVFNGECQSDWGCVEKTLRDQEKDKPAKGPQKKE